MSKAKAKEKETAIKKASVGRIVHYYNSSFLVPGPHAAIVTEVSDDGLRVNLKVFPSMSDGWDEEGVLPFDEDTNLDRYWVWPPREEPDQELQSQELQKQEADKQPGKEAA